MGGKLFKSIDEETSNDECKDDVSKYDNFRPFKSFICNHRDECCNKDLMLDTFKKNLENSRHIKNPKTKQYGIFWSNVIDILNKDDDRKVDDDYDDEDESKQVMGWIDGFEKDENQKSFDSMNKKLTDYLSDTIENIFISLLDAMTRALHETQTLQIEFIDFYEALLAVPILDYLLPSLPSGWDSTLPPDDHKFYNWALTVQSNPDQVRTIKRIDDIKQLILDSQKDETNRKKVRVSVFKHSFSPLFSDNDEYYHGLLLPHEMTTVNIRTPEHKYNEDMTLSHVVSLPETTGIEILDNNKIRVHCGSSNESYRDLVSKRLESGLSFPSETSNVVQVFQSFCGTHAVACHGGGIGTTTLCDDITKLKMINYKGDEVVYEGDILKKMGAHFGLLGIVTEMEIQYEPSYLALYQPKRRLLTEYFPKTGECVEFQNDVNNNYYNEFFWFPFSDEVFINVWKRTFNDINNYQRFPSEITKTSHKFEAAAFQTMSQLIPGLQSTGWRGKLYAKMCSILGDRVLKAEDNIIRCPSFDALHFRHGVQDMRVLNMEWAIALNELKDNDGNNILIDNKTVPDVSLCRDLWLACTELNKYYAEELELFPSILPLEMRIIGESQVCLSAAHGSPFTVYIEILNIIGNKETNDLFYRYCQDLTDKWAQIAGTENMRPHWGKLWQGLTVNGKSIHQHLRETYKDDIAEFNQIREKADPHNIFINDALSKIFLNK